MKLAIIGADGMLGSEFVELCLAKGIEHRPFLFPDIDITDINSLVVIKEYAPDVIINCSAYTAVDKAEDDVDAAYAANGAGVRNLAEIAKVIGCKLVHFSTDYVFSGISCEPYLEQEVTAPVSVYGKSKLKGELAIKEVLAEKDYLLLRTAWLYGKGGPNFVKTMIKLAEDRDELSVVDDQVGSPTLASDLAKWTISLLERKEAGTFHAVNSGSCTWFSFAKKIFELKEIDIIVNPVSSNEFKTRAVRPAYSVMNNLKLKKSLNYPIREWSEALSEHLFVTNI